MTLKKFLSKYEDLAKELIRCGSCTNILLHCGGEEKYQIVKIGGKGKNNEEESILCETCQRNNRNIELVTRVSSEDNNHIFQIPISQ
jgi:hypothetical protein